MATNTHRLEEALARVEALTSALRDLLDIIDGMCDDEMMEDEAGTITAARAALSGQPTPDAQVPDGWKLVPIKATSAQIKAGCDEHVCEQGDPWYGAPHLDDHDAEKIYEAMLKAAPLPTPPTTGEE